MTINMRQNRYCVIFLLNEIQVEPFFVMLYILLSVIMCVIDIQILNYLRYNFQFNIWYCDNIMSSLIKTHHLWECV